MPMTVAFHVCGNTPRINEALPAEFSSTTLMARANARTSPDSTRETASI